MQVTIIGARGRFKRDALLQTIAEARHAHDCVVQAFDPGAVYGRAHLEAAAAKAVRAHEEGHASANDLATEIACYAAGDAQIARALEVVGLPPSGDAVVLLALGENGAAVLEDVCEGAGLRRDDGVVQELPGTLDRLGIPTRVMEMVGREKWDMLVLERVAMVDATK